MTERIDAARLSAMLTDVRQKLGDATHCCGEGSCSPENSAIEHLIDAVWQLHAATNALLLAATRSAGEEEPRDA